MKKYLTLIFCLLLSACSGNNLSPSGDTHSNTSSSPYTLSISSRISLSPSFENDLAYTIQLQEARTYWKRFKILSGGESSECEAGHDLEFEIKKNQNLLENLNDEFSLGTFTIENRSYCRYQFELGKAASTQLNHAGHVHEEENLNEESLLFLKGTWSKNGSSGTFEWNLSGEEEIIGNFVALENGHEELHPLHFHNSQTSSKNFELNLEKLFQGLDLQQEASSLEIQLRSNLRSSLGLHFEGH